jgi:hypothetical protein
MKLSLIKKYLFNLLIVDYLRKKYLNITIMLLASSIGIDRIKNIDLLF